MAGCLDGIDVDATQRDGRVTISGTLMHRQGFCILDASPLYDLFNAEGADLSIPFRDGSLAVPRRRKTADVSLPFVVDGKYNTGIPALVNDNYRSGLFYNLSYLRSTILELPGTPDGTRSIGLTLPGVGETEQIAFAHVHGWQFDKKSARVWQGVLDFSFPFGFF